MEKTVKVSREVHQRLTELGGKGETYNDIIKRLIVFFEENEELVARMEREGHIPLD